jgi:pimeloyl-ACP methyl ester carboxylesterase
VVDSSNFGKAAIAMRQDIKGMTDIYPALAGDRREIDTAAGRLSYYAAGLGDPMLLIHSVNAAASAYEVLPIYDHERRRRRVYAVDLPGFGFSDRSPRTYTVELFTNAVLAMLSEIGSETGPAPVDAMALSLSSEFLARAALEREERIKTLTLVTPTGFSAGYRALISKPGTTREVPGLHTFLSVPLWSHALFSLLVRRGSIRYFLERTWGSKNIDEGMVDYDYRTSHQPGAQYAPYAFVSGRLFSRDIRKIYEAIPHPVWMPHGTRGDFRDFSAADWVDSRRNWTKQPFDTGALPHFEQPTKFLESYDQFLAGQESGAAALQPTSSKPEYDVRSAP